jgi:hypothetical protein
MSMKKHIALAALTACALTLSALGSQKNPVERPFKCEATATWTVSLLDGSAIGHHTGVATHAGRFIADGPAIWDLENFVILSGAGVSTGADGDQLFWRMTQDQLDVVQIYGGTGRFEKATGSAPTVASELINSETHWDTMTVTLTVTYTLVGTITY